MLVLTIVLMFIYSAFNPLKQITLAGAVLAKRVRIGLMTAIMLLSVTVGYQLPVDIGNGFARLAQNQADQQAERFERKMMAEQHHVARMMELFGGNERYLNYLNASNAKKTPF